MNRQVVNNNLPLPCTPTHHDCLYSVTVAVYTKTLSLFDMEGSRTALFLVSVEAGPGWAGQESTVAS